MTQAEVNRLITELSKSMDSKEIENLHQAIVAHIKGNYIVSSEDETELAKWETLVENRKLQVNKNLDYPVMSQNVLHIYKMIGGLTPIR